MKKPNKENKIPLNEMLASMDRRDVGFYDRLSDDQKKDFQPWLAMRYFSSSKSMPLEHLILTNQTVNVGFSTLSKHPKLQWMSLCTVGCGRVLNYDHNFIPPARNAKKDKLSEMLSVIYPTMNTDELKLFININEKSDIISLLEGYGYDEKTVKQAFK